MSFPPCSLAKLQGAEEPPQPDKHILFELLISSPVKYNSGKIVNKIQSVVRNSVRFFSSIEMGISYLQKE